MSNTHGEIKYALKHFYSPINRLHLIPFFFIQNVLGDICEEFKETFTNIFILQNQQCK